MHRVRVRSSNIASVGYDPDSAILEIEFNDGGVYQYSQVSERHFRGLMTSGSVGGYFHRHIKGSYRYRQVR
ncbi:MAG: KTSC domain-containing protein [Thermoleophilia bacterium]|nr:KTSC domain-containing protein [Thermoleophilia bacterium]